MRSATPSARRIRIGNPRAASRIAEAPCEFREQRRFAEHLDEIGRDLRRSRAKLGEIVSLSKGALAVDEQCLHRLLGTLLCMEGGIVRERRECREIVTTRAQIL